VPFERVRVGDLVRIRPGERVPVDGVVESGESDVDESLVTGEPRLVEKVPGDQPISGSLNGHGTLLVPVTVIGDESFLRQVIRSVEDARALKPGILHLVGRVLQVYTPFVLLTALGATIFWLLFPLLTGSSPDLQQYTHTLNSTRAHPTARRGSVSRAARHNERVFGINRGLHVVSRSCAIARAHKTSFRFRVLL
jgi:cation transport ATPase